MRIDLSAGVGATETSLEKSGARAAAASHTTPDAEFSHKQATVSSLAAAALAAPEVRHEKVQALQAKLRSGTYQVSSAQTAASLLDHLRAT